MFATTTFDQAVKNLYNPSAWITCGTPDCKYCKQNAEDLALEKARIEMSKKKEEVRIAQDAYAKAANLIKDINNKRAEEQARVAKEKADKERKEREAKAEKQKAEQKAKRERVARIDRDVSGFALRFVDEKLDSLPKSADGIALQLAQQAVTKGTRYGGSSNALALWLAKELNSKIEYYYGKDAPKVTVYVERTSVILESPRFQVTFDVQTHVTEFMNKLQGFVYPAITFWN